MKIGNIQEEKLSYIFYVSDEELLVSVGTYMERNRGKTNNKQSSLVSYDSIENIILVYVFY